MKKFLKTEDGRKVAVWLNTEERTVEFAGADQAPQYVPSTWDTHDYRYTHGGALYQKACELLWDIENGNV